VFCPSCGKPISLRDTLEKQLDSPTTKTRVRRMEEEESTLQIDRETSELRASRRLEVIVA
jgi:hypothetical protein